MEKTNIQTDFDKINVADVRRQLEEFLQVKVSIELKEITHLFDGENEPRTLGYGYSIELETPVMCSTQLASHLSIAGLLAFMKGFSWAYYYGKNSQHEIETEFNETATNAIYEDIPF